MNERLTALHEAAHAVVLYRLLGHCGSVTIVPDLGAGSLGALHDDGCSDVTQVADLEGQILSSYAGGHAERIAEPSVESGGCAQDDEQAAEYARSCGWEARETEFRARSRDLVLAYWNEIEAVATELMTMRSLESTEVEIIADATAGDATADIAVYRRTFGDALNEWRRAMAQDRAR